MNLYFTYLKIKWIFTFAVMCNAPFNYPSIYPLSLIYLSIWIIHLPYPCCLLGFQNPLYLLPLLYWKLHIFGVDNEYSNPFLEYFITISILENSFGLLKYILICWLLSLISNKRNEAWDFQILQIWIMLIWLGWEDNFPIFSLDFRELDRLDLELGLHRSGSVLIHRFKQYVEVI